MTWRDASVNGTLPAHLWKSHVPFMERKNKTCRLLQTVTDDRSFGTSSSIMFWVPFQEFQCSMHIMQFMKTRTTVKMMLEDMSGNQYHAFPAAFMNIINHASNGTVSGMWAFKKQGRSWSIELEQASIR